ncbi:glycosyltransferase family 4 protein [Phytohabitans houttuyneae]|uniref:Glycosyltransferase subfamily 4-like N-terminal domain-containing protein n=1 Tax=Phytohabitans houttuyneae TaxID=1076126 RepID=A0A6V8KUK6_9ACTN|nr:glycosyltransferase [Phytohabitans houttuyneae]GFJ84265.1 hypothetical protein Phou_084450 [Phytohabitans houttuyneae]
MSAGGRRPRVLLYTGVDAVGGAEVALGNLVGGLGDTYEVHVAGTDETVVRWLAAHRPGLAHHVTGGGGARAHARLLRHVRPDVVQANLEVPWASPTLLATALALRRPRVVAVHHMAARTVDLPLLLRTRALALRLDANVAVSADGARRVEDFYALGRGSLHVIHNGVPLGGNAARPRLSPAAGRAGQPNADARSIVDRAVHPDADPGSGGWPDADAGPVLGRGGQPDAGSDGWPDADARSFVGGVGQPDAGSGGWPDADAAPVWGRVGQPDADPASGGWPDADAASVVACVGRLDPVKGQDVLIGALPRLPGVRARLIGAGAQEPALRAQAARLGVADRVELTGWTDRVDEHLRDVDIYVQPSRYETLGLALIEAMGAGLPCVATATGGVPEVLDGGRCGHLVPTGDTAALADAIGRLAADPARRRRLGRQARERALAAFTAERMARRYESLWAEVLAAPPASRLRPHPPKP